MSVQGFGRGQSISNADAIEASEAEAADVAQDAAASAAPPAPAALKGAPLPSRMDVQRALAERSAAAAAAAGIGAIDGASASSAGGVGKHEKLRAAFDKIDAPVGEAKTYRMDENTKAFASRWSTLEKAETSIDTTYFIWNSDVFGMAYLGHMMAKAKDGVAVRGMIDATADAAGMQGFKGAFRGQDYLQELVGVDPKKVQFGVFNPVLKKDYTSLSSAISANHDKLAIVDGKMVETGGRNMAAHYYSDPKDHHGVYRDTDIHVESPVAAKSATAAFEAEFNNDKIMYRVKPEKFGNWVKRDIEMIGAYAMMDEWLKAPPFSEAERAKIRAAFEAKDEDAINPYVNQVMDGVMKRLPKEGIKRDPSFDDVVELRKLAKELVSNPSLRGAQRETPEAMQTEVKIIDKVSHSSVGMNNISDAFISVIDSASESIEIHNPYVVLTDRALEALAKAAKRGVEVKIITNSPQSTDSALTQAFFLEDWPMIQARIPGCRILVATGDQKHHSKSFVVDGVLTGVTTYNADWLSARVNSEVAALSWSEEFAKDTLKSYDHTLGDKEHGFVEYKIKRDADGKALIKNGKPIIEYGPENHVPKKDLDGMLSFLRKAVTVARNNLDALTPLKHKPLDPATDPVRIVK